MGADCKSALNVALLAIPQGMAYALIAGLPIQYGLFRFFCCCFVWKFIFKFKIYYTRAYKCYIRFTFGVFASLGLINQEGMGSEKAIEVLPWILFFAGLFLIVAAILRISFMIQFVSRTVITAYVTAAAALIIANQTKHIFGLELDSSDSVATFGKLYMRRHEYLMNFLPLFSLAALLQ